MSEPVTGRLFEVLARYAADMKAGRIKPKPALGATSPALTFCENFYAQFFQNGLNKEIRQFNNAAKEAAIRLRLELRVNERQGPPSVLMLITWYEKLCDIYPTVLALGYGIASRTAFDDFHHNYLLTLLQRAEDWAKVENYPTIAARSRETHLELKEALQLISGEKHGTR